MNQISPAHVKPSPLADAYARDGFFFPYDVMGEAEAAELLADLEAGEAELAAPERRAELSMLRAYTARLLPSFDRLIRHPRLIDAVSQVLGRDLLVWQCTLFIKEPNTRSYVSWHQDLAYWGLDELNEVTAWVALSPATTESGCMRFVPGSHHERLVPHVDSFAADNLLTRGQEIAVKVDEASAVEVVLRPGQASLHHGHLFHSSGPNRTEARRVGVAIRYITPSMKQVSGAKLLVAHVSGRDDHGHFTVAPPPAGRLLTEDFERCRRDVQVKRGELYKGVAPELIRSSK